MVLLLKKIFLCGFFKFIFNFLISLCPLCQSLNIKKKRNWLWKVLEKAMNFANQTCDCLATMQGWEIKVYSFAGALLASCTMNILLLFLREKWKVQILQEDKIKQAWAYLSVCPFLLPFILCQHCNKQTALWCRREISPAYVSPDSLARPPLSSLSDEDSKHESSPTLAAAMSDEEITFNFSRQTAGQLRKPCGLYSAWCERLLKSENCSAPCVFVRARVCMCTRV